MSLGITGWELGVCGVCRGVGGVWTGVWRGLCGSAGEGGVYVSGSVCDVNV